MYACMYACMYAYMLGCMNMYIYIYICTYTYAFPRQDSISLSIFFVLFHYANIVSIRPPVHIYFL